MNIKCQYKITVVRFEVLRVVLLNIQVFWDVTLCCYMNVY